MLIDKREIERVKRANELVGFIRSRGVSLTQHGKQLVGLCPFHNDHEPSLVVDARLPVCASMFEINRNEVAFLRPLM